MPTDTALPLRIGARTLLTLRRRLIRRRLSLEEALAGARPALSPLAADEHGYLVTALPEALAVRVAGASGLSRFVRQRYKRYFARLDLGFESYLATFSAKSRSTCRRKLRRFAERSGGEIDVRAFASEEEIASFYQEARALSARTYQERLLDAGLPEGEEALDAMRALARAGAARGWLLYLDGRAIAYLYAPSEGATLIYAYLGYDPEYADLSPGTVLQLEAMRLLMDEGAFALFDFTEGEGQHKKLFSTGSVDCVDLLLVRPGLANFAIGYALNGFDGAVALAKAMVRSIGAGRLVSALRR
jgi:CelD/BcsL family acetyltransferase involved in cellulose biosynthesis